MIDSKCWAPGRYWSAGNSVFRGFQRFEAAEKVNLTRISNEMANYLGTAVTVSPLVVIWPSHPGRIATRWPGMSLRLPEGAPFCIGRDLDVTLRRILGSDERQCDEATIKRLTALTIDGKGTYMTRAVARGRSTGDLDGIIWFLPLAALAGGAVVGIPGVGLYVGLVFAVWAFKVAGTKSPTNEQLLGALSSTVGHPFSAHVRTGPGDKWWPPNRLAAWWSLLGAGLLAAVPLVIHSASTLKLPHPLTVPALALMSFVGYFLSLHALIAAKRKERPPVVVERSVLREKSESVIGAAIVGASAGIIAFLAFAHASTIRALASTGHTAKFVGPDTYAGLGMKGAIGASLGIGFLAAFALASVGLSDCLARPSLPTPRQALALGLGVAHRRRANMAPPLFISEANRPRTALRSVRPSSRCHLADARCVRGEGGSSCHGSRCRAVSITPDVGRDESNAPMLGSSSTNVFKVSYPLVPIAPGAHLSHEFTSKGELYDFIVASTFRDIFAELKLGTPI